MSQPIAKLPSSVRRPLWRASLGIVVFLGGFVVWAFFAPLATTVALRGMIESSQPSFALQHPYGGHVEDVLVDVHDIVEKGQPLLVFDRSLERETLAAQVSIRDRLEAENSQIAALLAPGSQAFETVQDAVASPLFIRAHQLDLQAQSARQSIANLDRQINAVSAKNVHAESQLALMTERAERTAALSDRGIALRSDHERLEEQRLILMGEIESNRASIFNLEGQVTRARQQLAMAGITLEHELTSLRQDNLQRLDELQGRILDLTDRIEKSVVYAPVDGVVASLPIEAEHMIAARGDTLLTLARPLDQAQVSFTIPVDYIDQIVPGMSARLVIPSLPQRSAPKINLTIDAISPRARVDETGNPLDFAGLAIADTNIFETFEDRTDLGVLSEDMPVVLMVSVRKTTFASYLVSPLLSAFSKALQD